MSICRGLELIQSQWLANAAGQFGEADVVALMGQMLAQIEHNWLTSPRYLVGKRPSQENWRLEKRLYLAPHNTSPEKTLEKAIACLTDWSNQVPTASGLFDQHSDKLRNIDLVRQTGSSSYDCVELKVGSNTPIDAALEALTYAVLYLHARQTYTDSERASKALLEATSIQWMVLAPTRYYLGDRRYLDLGDKISESLSSVAQSLNMPCRMTFGYWAFPEEFEWPCEASELERLLGQVFPLRRERS